MKKEVAETAENKSLEATLEEIEKINTALEKGGLSLEEMMTMYKKGMKLAGYAEELIRNAKAEIKKLEDGKTEDLNCEN